MREQMHSSRLDLQRQPVRSKSILLGRLCAFCLSLSQRGGEKSRTSFRVLSSSTIMEAPWRHQGCRSALPLSAIRHRPQPERIWPGWCTNSSPSAGHGCVVASDVDGLWPPRPRAPACDNNTTTTTVLLAPATEYRWPWPDWPWRHPSSASYPAREDARDGDDSGRNSGLQPDALRGELEQGRWGSKEAQFHGAGTAGLAEGGGQSSRGEPTLRDAVSLSSRLQALSALPAAHTEAMPLALQAIQPGGKGQWTLEGFAFVSRPSMQEVRPFPPRFCSGNQPAQPLTATSGLSSLVTASGSSGGGRASA
jgi:hypothetical protein